MNCNKKRGRKLIRIYRVSIPNRDFGELQYQSYGSYFSNSCVSIPNRDFGELQLSGVELEEVEYKFQSLIGILVNCNFTYVGLIADYAVSIPNRDFGELQWE